MKRFEDKINDSLKQVWSLDVRHVKAHRTKKEKKSIDKTDGNEKADALATEDATYDEGLMAEI